MTNKYSFIKNLQIASIKSDSNYHNLSIHTLMQNIDQKQPSINAFLGARYSRSADSVVDIAKEIIESGTDAAKKLESIFSGYGILFCTCNPVINNIYTFLFVPESNI